MRRIRRSAHGAQEQGGVGHQPARFQRFRHVVVHPGGEGAADLVFRVPELAGLLGAVAIQGVAQVLDGVVEPVGPQAVIAPGAPAYSRETSVVGPPASLGRSPGRGPLGLHGRRAAHLSLMM